MRDSTRYHRRPLLSLSDPDDDAPGPALDEALRDLRKRFLTHASDGSWIEALHLVGPRIVAHVVIPPGSRAIVAGVIVSDRFFSRGEACVVPAALSGGDVLVRFVPSPARLLPADPSRLALLLLLMAACLSSVGAHRTIEPVSAPGVTQLDRSETRARRHARRVAGERVRVPARRGRVPARARRRRVMRVVRVVRVMRRAVPRRTAPEPDADPEDPNDRSIPSRRLPEPRARGPPASPCTRSCTPLTSNLVLEEDMLVVQLFVMKEGAFQGVEMAAGSRIVVGPPTADVPLAGVDNDGVVLTLRDDTLVASTRGGARVNGLAVVDGEVSPSHDVVIGAYVIKVRRMSASPAHTTAADMTTSVETPRARATANAPTVVAMAPLAPLEVELPVTQLLAVGDTLPEPIVTPSLAFLDALGDELDDAREEEDVDWSLVEQLARPPEGTGDLVEVIHAHGELVLAHALLAERDAFDHGARALVTRTTEGCRIELPAGSLARTRRGGALAEIIAGDKPLTVSLARGDAATLSIDDTVMLVRFVKRPELAWSADDVRVQKLERKAHALCVSAGVSLCSLWAVAVWIAQYRAEREMEISLPDDPVTWPEVVLVMKEAPKPVKLAEVVAAEPVREPERSSSTPAAQAPKPVARGGSTKNPAGTPLDAVKALPFIPLPSHALDEAMRHVREPIPGRPGGPRLTGLIGRGPRGDTSIRGSGIETGVSSRTMRGAGHLENKSERDIAGVVDRAKLNQLRTPAESGLSKEAILRVINQHIGEIQYCYEKGLRADASLGGRVVVEWTIGASGKVTGAREQTSSLAGNGVEDCMLQRIKTWTFPASKNTSAVVYPFSFSSL